MKRSLLNYAFTMIALTLGVSCFLAACEDTSADTEEIQVVVDSALSALADARLQNISDKVTKDFIAHPGKLDKQEAMRQLFVLFRVNRGLFVNAPTPTIEFGDDAQTATVKGPFIVTKRPTSSDALLSVQDDVEAWTRLASRYAEVQQADISLVKTDGVWKIDAARFF